MDTVTESRLAITGARRRHRDYPQKPHPRQTSPRSGESQTPYESGILRDPITVTPEMTIGQIIELAQDAGVSGFPWCRTKKSSASSPAAIYALEDYEAKVADKMTPRERLITVSEDDDLTVAKNYSTNTA